MMYQKPLTTTELRTMSTLKTVFTYEERSMLIEEREVIHALMLIARDAEADLCELHYLVSRVRLAEAWSAWDGNGYSYPRELRGRRRCVVDALLQELLRIESALWIEVFNRSEDLENCEALLMFTGLMIANEFGGKLVTEY